MLSVPGAISFNFVIKPLLYETEADYLFISFEMKQSIIPASSHRVPISQELDAKTDKAKVFWAESRFALHSALP